MGIFAVPAPPRGPGLASSDAARVAWYGTGAAEASSGVTGRPSPSTGAAIMILSTRNVVPPWGAACLPHRHRRFHLWMEVAMVGLGPRLRENALERPRRHARRRAVHPTRPVWTDTEERRIASVGHFSGGRGLLVG